ncbi:NnrS protein involved in response to NO [Paraburkholderia sabiae]|uniref:NnrS family protein n=1 Tax=Paraburkholderia sabiae TaxID=273251 RepID=UPI001CB26A71|nr:NnrS family protein [Paraburkholderia sabiae]CAG9196277.1 NnrS protein involved in response to NO [Paraburkholderia sabiae]
MQPVEPRATFVPPPGRYRPAQRFALLNLGFRPFYLAGAGFAVLALTVWLLVLAGVPAMGHYLLKLDPIGWHAHEMVFGFAASVVAGFLLTAVRAWTGMQTTSARVLAALVLLWLCARVLVWSGPAVPAALVDSAFLPCVAFVLLRVLMKAGNRRNYFLVPVLLTFAALNVAFHVLTQMGHADLALRCIYASAGIVVLLVSVIGARVIPMFTSNAIPGFITRRWTWVERIAAPLTLIALFADAAALPSMAIATLAFAACVVHCARMIGWRSYKVRGPVILLILHVAYAWMPIGFALLGLSALGFVAHSVALHAFTAGVIGGAIIAMITRTARGHTGRPLAADTRDVASYALVTLGSALRIVGPLVAPAHYQLWIWSAGVCWIAAFAIYVGAYARPLMRPREDGKPG